MSRYIDKEALVAAVKASQSLSDEQKADIIELIRTKKKYGLVWEDSPELAEQELKTKLPILREVAERRILNDSEVEHYPNHVLIEGENLQALIALTYTHVGMVDVIYIDPPYNTGNKDFVYNDSFIGEDDEYRHSKWLSFMERRLKIAKTLLSDKGVIFISIDDNEQANLKLLCDEVFGEHNCRNIINTRRLDKNLSQQFISKGIQSLAVGCEYVLVYSKTAEVDFFPIMREASDKRKEKGYWKGFWNAADRPTMRYEILGVTPETGQWKWESGKANAAVENYKRFQDALINNPFLTLEEYWKANGKNQKYIRRRKENTKGKNFGVEHWVEPSEGILRTSNWSDIITTETHLNMDINFSSPKSLGLIKELLRFGKNSSDFIILDFFAGSGTTLHATMQLNAEDGGHRQCILVTNNENGICENVTYERNKRVIQGYTTPKGEQVTGLSKNNLRYYKVKALPRDNTIRNRMKLAAGSLDMLCIMENLYQEKDVFGTMALNQKQCRYFEEDERSMLVLLNTDLIPQVVKQLKEMQPATPIHIYIYAPGDYAFDDEFEEVASKVELHPLPQPILNAYRQWLPKQDEVLLDVPDNYELTEAELNEIGEDFISRED